MLHNFTYHLLITASRELTTEHRRLAEIIEMIHTASLIHDDVIDESNLRRGRFWICWWFFACRGFSISIIMPAHNQYPSPIFEILFSFFLLSRILEVLRVIPFLIGVTIRYFSYWEFCILGMASWRCLLAWLDDCYIALSFLFDAMTLAILVRHESAISKTLMDVLLWITAHTY